jgi:hypothetical protein
LLKWLAGWLVGQELEFQRLAISPTLVSLFLALGGLLVNC